MSSVGRRVSELTTPALLVDRSKVEANCSNMLATCTSLGLSLRAHTKTHKTVEVAALQTGGTKRGLVTSTLAEAEFFADNGFDDILFGYPFIPHHLARVTELTRRLDQFHVMVDSSLAVKTLKAATPPPGKTWSVFLCVDCGNKREGVWWEDKIGVDLALELHQSAIMTFTGLYVHCGDAYSSYRTGDIQKVRDQTIERLTYFGSRLGDEGVSVPVIGIGSTPVCTHPGPTMRRLTDLHPGNYVFLDVQQVRLGSGKMENIACCVATRVIGHYPRRKQLLIDCGFMALTKQGIGQLPTGCCIFRDHPDLKLSSMTQEIGYVESVARGRMELDKYPIGSLLYIFPWHACATANLFSVYHVVEDDIVVEEWRPTRGW